jgi:hypothetical protein
MISLPITYKSVFHKLSVMREKFGYTPHAKQLEVHTSPARFKCVHAGARGGKSMLGGIEAAYLLLFPGMHIYFVSLLYSLSDKEMDWCLDFLSRYQWNDRQKLIDLCKISNPARGARRVETPWGSWAETHSAQNEKSLLGDEIDLHVIGEASHLPERAWKRQLYPRLGPRKGGALILSTPSWDSGFLKTMSECGHSKDPAYSDYATFEFNVLANPTFPEEEYWKAKATLPEDIFLEQYEGKFVSRCGYVFPMFSMEKHIIDELSTDFANWPVFRCMHHEKNSFNNPLVCLFVAQSPETHEFIVFDEYYEKEVVPVDACRDIGPVTSGRRLMTTLTDYYNPTLREIIKKNLGSANVNDEKGFSRRHAIVRKIQALQTALAVTTDGFPLIRIHKGCKRTIDNFLTAKWREPKKEELQMAEEELPATKNMPAPMALSYLIAFYQLQRGFDIYAAQGRKTA